LQKKCGSPGNSGIADGQGAAVRFNCPRGLVIFTDDRHVLGKPLCPLIVTYSENHCARNVVRRQLRAGESAFEEIESMGKKCF
jgi:hypothetical protein